MRLNLKEEEEEELIIPCYNQIKRNKIKDKGGFSS
jgi:hypothetical protein